MKKILFLFTLLIFCLSFSFAQAGDSEVTEKTITTQGAKCATPIAKIAIGKISCKAESCRQPKTPQTAFIQQLISLSGQPNLEGIGDGVGDMLLSALRITGCIDALEREVFNEIKRELELLGKDAKIEPADFLVSGSVTSIGTESTNTNLGLGFIPILSSVDIKKTTVTVSMDIRLIDISSAKIVFTKTYEANNSKTGVGVGAGAVFGGIGFGGVMSSLHGTPLEEVVRDIVIRAATEIASFAVNVPKTKPPVLTGNLTLINP